MKIEDYLSPTDVARLKDIKPVFESHNGEFLARDVESDTMDNCPKGLKRKFTEEGFDDIQICTVMAQRSDTCKLIAETEAGSLPSLPEFRFHPTEEALVEFYLQWCRKRHRRKKLSAGLSEFLFPSVEGDTRVEFRSSVPSFWDQGQLKVVCVDWKASPRVKRAAGKFCLAACNDGTVKWLPDSDCVDGNQIWKVHLFERPVGDVLYLRDELRRIEPNVYNSCVFSTTSVGGNINSGMGTQIVGDVNYNLGLRDFRTGLTATGESSSDHFCGTSSVPVLH